MYMQKPASQINDPLLIIGLVKQKHFSAHKIQFQKQ